MDLRQPSFHIELRIAKLGYLEFYQKNRSNIYTGGFKYALVKLETSELNDGVAECYRNFLTGTQSLPVLFVTSPEIVILPKRPGSVSCSLN